MSAETDKRLEHLETQLAFQEDLLETLNQTLICQQKDISRLVKIIEKMSNQLNEVAPQSVIAQHLETPPPHY